MGMHAIVGWNIQGPVNMIDLCHALHLHRHKARAIYAKLWLTSGFTSPQRLFKNCPEQKFHMRSEEDE